MSTFAKRPVEAVSGFVGPGLVPEQSTSRVSGVRDTQSSGSRCAGGTARVLPPLGDPDAYVSVGPFRVLDSSAADVRSDLVTAAAERRTVLAYALHVGGLNARADREFVDAMASADLVYADGVSIVKLARLNGARRIERAPTTDLGWELLRELQDRLGRRVRVALVGGNDGRSAAAGEVLREELGVDVVVAECGYQSDWKTCLSRLRSSDCDVLLVGLGAPQEMKWVQEHRAELPPCLVLTCGGWFGFVVQVEKRAPLWVQDLGLEWCFRLAQAPRRLGRRYMQGSLVCLAVALGTVRQRWQPSQRSSRS